VSDPIYGALPNFGDGEENPPIGVGFSLILMEGFWLVGIADFCGYRTLYTLHGRGHKSLDEQHSGRAHKPCRRVRARRLSRLYNLVSKCYVLQL